MFSIEIIFYFTSWKSWLKGLNDKQTLISWSFQMKLMKPEKKSFRTKNPIWPIAFW